jgi:hypothetical protein
MRESRERSRAVPDARSQATRARSLQAANGPPMLAQRPTPTRLHSSWSRWSTLWRRRGLKARPRWGVGENMEMTTEGSR